MLELSSSQGKYLKAIYSVSLKGEVTITKIANYLNCSKPSVVRALKNLSEINLIIYKHDFIKLSEIGLKYVKNIIRRDNVLQKFLVNVLEVNPVLAKKDAENIKHSVSCYTITKLENYLKQVLDEQIVNEKDYCLCEIKEKPCNNCLN